MKARLTILAALSLGLGCGGVHVPPASQSQAIADLEVAELVRLVNGHRRSIGCPPLTWHRRLAAVAQRHSVDMATRHFFGHESPEGFGPFKRLRDAMIGYQAAAENVAGGYARARDVFDAWMSSPHHREALEDCRYTHHGIGRYENRWTHMFLTPSRSP